MACIIYEVKTAPWHRAPLMQTNTHNPISLTAERLLASDKVTGMIMLFLELLIDLDMPEALQVAAVNAQTTAKMVERDLLEALNMANIIYDGRWSHAPEHILALAASFGWSIEDADLNGHSRDRVGTTQIQSQASEPVSDDGDEVMDVLLEDNSDEYDLSHYDGWSY